MKFIISEIIRHDNPSCTHSTPVVNILGISFGSFQSIVRDSWNMGQFATEFMPCTYSICFSEFLAKNKMIFIPHPPYLPSVVPCDLFPFPKLKEAVKVRKFNDIARIQTKS
jgi:hypothetical protein